MSDDLIEMLDDAQRSTETEILSDAFKDEPEKPGETETQPEPKVENRDPATGQFKAKEEAKTEPEGKDEAHVPSGRLREETALRKAAEAERDKLVTQFETLSKRLESLEKPKQETKQEDIDPLLDPNGFTKRIQEGFASELRKIELNSNLAIAHVRHGEKFEKAYEALLAEGQKGNRQLVNSLVGQPNPGEAIVKWFTNQEVLREVGGDPAAYKAKLLEEALKDPNYLQKAVETFRNQANGGSQQQKPRVELPPSLSRASGSSKNVDPIDTDNSDRAVFDYAFSK